jgi:signal transduction histidine kinase
VRENRTQRSVRGRSENWPSYLDGESVDYMASILPQRSKCISTQKWTHMAEKPTYEELAKRIQELEKAESYWNHEQKKFARQKESYRLLLDISTKCINIPIDEIENAINTSLKRIGEYVNADRAYIFKYDFEKNIGINTYEWCADGIAPQIQNLQESPIDAFSEWVEAHRNGEPVVIHAVSERPAGSMKDILEQQDIKSLLSVPVFQNGILAGFTGFDSVKKRYKYVTSDIEIVQIFNKIVMHLNQYVEQEQEGKKQKMDALGRLSASFAHEFGNPLMGVRSVLKDIGDRISMDDSDRRLLKLAYQECERMKTLIRDFQRFQRDSSTSRELHDVHDILENVLVFYAKRIAENNIELQKDYGKNIPEIFMRRDQITQVFVNLINNSFDAMAEHGGVLKISTRVDSEGLDINISDTGIGIADENHELIFGPFFTTKADVEGVGLGLYVSYGIVSSHGGEIKVVSKTGKGASFTVRLPRKEF